MAEIPKKYNFAQEEQKWKKLWADQNLYKFDKNSKKPIYSIDTPPPYASAGHLHVGHAMSYTQPEIIARFKRMNGFEIFYPMGFDDNGLPTERFVEKKHKINKSKISKKDFIKLCLDETKNVGVTYKEMFSNLGISVDWSLLYSTISDRCVRVAQKSFLDLYKKGLLERRQDPVFWDTVIQSSLSQADLTDLEKHSSLNDIVFKGPEGEDLVIATTRPELIPACVALFVNEKDERYKHLIGKKAKVPLFDYEVPIVADDKVMIDYGTGLMMVCTWGDIEDIERWRLHNLDTRVVIEQNGRLSKLAGEFAGLKAEEARTAILDKLKEQELLLQQHKIKHVVNVGERTQAPVEFIAVNQWFIKVLDKKDQLIEAANNINWYPAHMKKRYDTWVENLKWDWNISRQRYYGVPFPVWYSKKTGEIILPSEDQLPIFPETDVPSVLPEGHTPDDIVAETDVMDTWMTSSVSPLINADWGSDQELMDKIYPMSLRPQAHDIIRTWAFYTITKSLYHHDDKPWKDIMISGHGQDAKGRKMSKSLGNVVVPEKIIEQYSADALRFWSASVKLGEDLAFQEKELATGKKTVTKLWNASKFAAMHLEDYDGSVPAKEDLQPIDIWALTKMNKTIEDASASFEEYEYSKARHTTDRLFWNVLADNYMEIVKDRLYKPEIYGDASRKAAQYTLKTLLVGCMKMYAPIMPFITESCYQYFFSEDGVPSIHVSSWPTQNEFADESFIETGDKAIEVLAQIRKAKSQNSDALNVELSELQVATPHSEDANIFANDIKAAAKADTITFSQSEEESVTYTKKE